MTHLHPRSPRGDTSCVLGPRYPGVFHRPLCLENSVPALHKTNLFSGVNPIVPAILPTVEPQPHSVPPTVLFISFLVRFRNLTLTWLARLAGK